MEFPGQIVRDVTIRVWGYDPGHPGNWERALEAPQFDADAIDAAGTVYTLTADELDEARDEYEQRLDEARADPGPGQ